MHKSKRASAEKKAGSNQTGAVNNPSERQSWDGVGEVPEWVDRAFKEAANIMDEALAKIVRKRREQKRRG